MGKRWGRGRIRDSGARNTTLVHWRYDLLGSRMPQWGSESAGWVDSGAMSPGTTLGRRSRRLGDFMDWIWGLVIALVILWVIGLAVKIGGKLIHLLLVAAVLIVLARLISG